MPKKVRRRLVKVIKELEPSDLLHQARAVVLNRAFGGWDVADGEEDSGDAERPWQRASRRARKIGKALAADRAIREQFMGEVFAEQVAQRAFECGCGLAEGTEDLADLWTELAAVYQATPPHERNATLLGGFLQEAARKDPAFCASVLDTAGKGGFATELPYLQAQVGLNEDAVSRLRIAIADGVMSAGSFRNIANVSVRDVSAAALASLLRDISCLPDAVGVALDILSLRFSCDRDAGPDHDLALIECGRELLRKAHFSGTDLMRDYGLRQVVKVCLAGDLGREAARVVCDNLRAALEDNYVSSHNASYILDGLFRTQPQVALDAFLLPGPPRRSRHLFEAAYGLGAPIERISPEVLCEWADNDPVMRYPLVASCLGMFNSRSGDGPEGISHGFLEVLDRAPDKAQFLGDFWRRIHPRSWSGSLAEVLTRRRQVLKELEDHPDLSVRRWHADIQPDFDRWLATERGRETQREESFE
jgi:hypothetical protein